MHNIDLNYVRKGGGNDITIVFLHHFGGAAQTWSTVIDELSGNCHCIAIDLCGFGHSPSTAWEVSIHEHAQYVIDLIKDLKLTDYILVGHEMGAKIALYVASKQGSNVKSLILAAPSSPKPEHINEQDHQALLDAFADKSAIEEIVLKSTALPLREFLFEQTVQYYMMSSQTGWESWLLKGSREDISAVLFKITVPVMVVSGSKDLHFPSEKLKTEFSDYFPDATFKEIIGSGYMIPLEAPKKLAELIESFLE